ncbi:hypothetical protein [Sorangium sp. So ce1099]|uniref:hypothetical protein n=1 Tax=Sorangium sp. So ce1099 TaxID=3133331 RepID=UPI003F601CF7
MGLGRIDVDARPTSANVQFFTEYSFVESIVGEAKARFPGAPVKKDTPDVLIYIAGPRRALTPPYPVFLIPMRSCRRG